MAVDMLPLASQRKKGEMFDGGVATEETEVDRFIEDRGVDITIISMYIWCPGKWLEMKRRRCAR